jgi:hypothetical protein
VAHFAHDGAPERPDCRETALHRYAKQVIAEAATLFLPDWTGAPGMPNPPRAPDGEGRVVVGERIEAHGGATPIRAGRTEVLMGPVRADVAVEDAEGTLLVEVCVSHAVDAAKRTRVGELGVRMVEIDLGPGMPPDVVDAAACARWVTHDAPRRWIAHPGAEDRWREARAAVDAIIASRTPVYGPGNNVLSRLPGHIADEVRALVATGRTCMCDGGGHELVGASVWVEGVGHADVALVHCCLRGVYTARGGDGREHQVFLPRGSWPHSWFTSTEDALGA